MQPERKPTSAITKKMFAFMDFSFYQMQVVGRLDHIRKCNLDSLTSRSSAELQIDGEASPCLDVNDLIRPFFLVQKSAGAGEAKHRLPCPSILRMQIRVELVNDNSCAGINAV